MLYRLFWCSIHIYFLFSIWKVVSACQNESGKKVNAPILLAICGFCAEKKRKKIRILRSFAAICILHLRLLYHTRKACTSHATMFWQDFDQDGPNLYFSNQPRPSIQPKPTQARRNLNYFNHWIFLIFHSKTYDWVFRKSSFST